MSAYGLNTSIGSAISCEIYVNSARVAATQPGHVAMQSLAIQHEVVPGNNLVEVLVTGAGVPPMAPPRPVQVDNVADFFVELELDYEEVEELGDSYRITTTSLKDVSWRAADSGDQFMLPHRVQMPFESTVAMAPPIWTRGAAMEPEAVRAALVAELQGLRQLLIERDLTRFQSRMRLRNEDMARAFPYAGSAAQRAEQETGRLEARLQDPALTFLPIDGQTLVLRSFANGRIIEPIRPDGKAPILFGKAGGELVALSFAFAMIDSRLEVVR